jgi:hypothetical protein
MRRILAQKAFGELALSFFNLPEVDSDSRHWVWGLSFFGDLFPAIQNFFRLEKNWSDHLTIRNLSGRNEVSNHERTAITFLLRLVEKIWNWRETQAESWRSDEEKEKIRRRNAELKTRFDAAKPWAVELLAFLWRYDLLRQHLCSLGKFEEAGVAALEEIALRTTIEDPVTEKERPVKTLEEAVYGHSRAAMLVLELRLKQREARRLQKLRDAAYAKRQAEREIAKHSK